LVRISIQAGQPSGRFLEIGGFYLRDFTDRTFGGSRFSVQAPAIKKDATDGPTRPDEWDLTTQ
jgi:hypothetical protein